MSQIHASQYDDSTWELPIFEEVNYGEKRHKHALVIPVINEGNRIREQLQRIQAADLPVDVVVADGGSTDGSLDPDYMRKIDVTAVLTKTGPGKLSAQLRMAYAWCIRRGYEGIVTIDGNGKDGVEAVASMVSLLQDGYDYVQGTRYLPGGKAENTPLERTIGNRLIHAPLLSLAGRHWYTDTTNGFRAYSINYLLDPRVQPFRNIFQKYELLFYLTVRAGQIGMKVGEVAVRRTYPQSGNTPTKITGLGGKADILRQTVFVALGRYAPPPPLRAYHGRVFSRPYSTMLMAVFFACLAWLFEGYRFGRANHGQEIPPILALVDPSLYSLDFAVQSFLEPGPRYFYYQLVSTLSSSFGVGVDKVLLALKILAHFSFFFAVTLIIREVLDRAYSSRREWSRKDVLLAGVFVACCSFPITSWGSDIYNASMVPSTLGMAIAIWSLFFAIREKWVAAFFSGGIAVIFHFLVGLFAGLVLVPALLMAALKARSWRVVAVPIAIWITPALVIYAMIIESAQAVPASFNFLEIFGEFRVPHHWLPSTGSWYKWASDIMLVLSAVLSLAVLLRAKQRHVELGALLAGILFVAICGVVANIVFVEVFSITFIGKLQFQRIMPFGQLAAYLLIISGVLAVWNAERTGHEGRTPWLVGGSVLLAMPSILGAVIKYSVESNFFLVVSLLFLAGLILFTLATTGFRIVMTVGVAVLLVFVNLPIVSRMPAPVAKKLIQKFQPFYDGKWSGVEISNWIRENTPIDAIVVIPPDWSEVSNFMALYSQRGVFFSFKNVPYSDHGVWEWAQRAEALLGVAVGPELRINELRDYWRTRSVDDILEIARSAGACFLVDRIDDRGDIGLMPIVTSQMRGGEEWGLWRLENCEE